MKYMFWTILIVTLVHFMGAMDTSSELIATYDCMSAFFPDVVQRIQSLTALQIWDTDTYVPGMNAYVIKKPKNPFTPQELSRRYPWDMIRGIFNNTVTYRQGDRKPIAMDDISALNYPIEVVGPNHNLYSIIQDEPVNVAVKCNVSKMSSLMSWFKRVKSPEKTFLALPGAAVAIHPDKNICAVVLEKGGMGIYDLEAHTCSQLRKSYDIRWNEDVPVLAEFDAYNRLLVLHDGCVRIYSVDTSRLVETIDFTSFINQQEFMSYSALESERRLSSRGDDKDGVGCGYVVSVDDFDYVHEYPHTLLCRVKFSYFLEQAGGVHARCTLPLRPFVLGKVYHALYDFQSRTCSLLPLDSMKIPRGSFWYWDSSIELYRLRSITEWYGRQPHQRNTISLISWEFDDIKDWIITRAAYQWLQSEPCDRRVGVDILKRVCESNHTYKLLWRAQYRDDHGATTNPFKRVFEKLVLPAYASTHVTCYGGQAYHEVTHVRQLLESVQVEQQD